MAQETEKHGNGKKGAKDLPGKDGTVDAGKDGKKTQTLPPFMTGGQIMGLISSKQMPSALDALSQPGDSPRQLSMRTILTKRTEGRTLGIAIAYHLERCREFHDKYGEEGILDMEALWVSDEGQGRRQLTEAITGQRNHEEAVGGGGLAKLLEKGWNK